MEAALQHYREEVDHIAERITQLEQAIDEAVKQAPPEIRAVIEALQALRGVAQTTALRWLRSWEACLVLPAPAS